MAETAFIYDAIRTPRSKGKADGSLHEVKPINLVTTLLEEMQQRHDLDTSRVDDVMLGCVAPVMEPGAVLPKIALQKAGWDAGVPGAQVTAIGCPGAGRRRTGAGAGGRRARRGGVQPGEGPQGRGPGEGPESGLR